jgi:hypothetical protein
MAQQQQSHHQMQQVLTGAARTQAVASLEAELLRLSLQRDQVDLAYRRMENMKLRSVAEVARRDALRRDLEGLTQQVGQARGRLRQLAAIER